MKKAFYIFLSALLLILCSSCSNVPDNMQADIYLGTTKDLKLLHLNASTAKKEEQIQKMYEAVTDASPIDKPIELFAFYPDYTIEVDDLSSDSGERIQVVLDVNRDRLEFYSIKDGDDSSTIYLSNMSVDEFKTYINME